MDGNAQPSPFCPECRSNGRCEWAELQRVVGPASPCRPYDAGIDDTRRVKAAAHVYPGGRLTSGHDISRNIRIQEPDQYPTRTPAMTLRLYPSPQTNINVSPETPV